MTTSLVETPPQLGGYRLLREVGRGTSAVVWEAEHVTLKKRVAVKVLHAERAGKAILAARFVREGQAAARIRHPHVVDVLDVGEQAGRPYLVMELVSGPTLASQLREGEGMSPSRVLDLMLPVLAAVQHAHDCGVLHRDLKPANILIGRDRHGEPRPMVADFGISKLTDEPLATTVTEDGALVGTLAYMPPEQVQSPRSVDARADQYALAVILYQGLTGMLPYEAETAFGLLEAITRGGARSARVHRPNLPVALDEALRRAMSVARGDRFPSVRELARALLPFASARAWGAFARDFEAPEESAATTFPEGTCDESPRAVDTGEPLAVDVRKKRAHRARAARWAIACGAGVVALTGLTVASRVLRTAEPKVAQPPTTIPVPVQAAPIQLTATPLATAPAAPEVPSSVPPIAPERRPAKPARVGSSRAAVAEPVPATSALPPAPDAGAPSSRPRSIELGDHGAPIVE